MCRSLLIVGGMLWRRCEGGKGLICGCGWGMILVWMKRWSFLVGGWSLRGGGGSGLGGLLLEN